MEIDLSVIVPIYKVPVDLLKKCINSLLQQNIKKYEIILIDDGSPDDCPKICDEFAKQNSLIKVIHQKNKGLCGARNMGVANAKGKWITFVDGDDWIERNGFSTILNKLNDDCSIICFGTIKEFGNKNYKYTYGGSFEDNHIYNSSYFLSKLFDWKNEISDVTAKFYLRDFLIKNDIFHNEDLKQGIEAIVFNYIAFNNNVKVQFINDFVYHYSYNENSITLKQNKESINYLMMGLNILEKKVIESENDDLIDSFYGRVKYVIVTTIISGIFSPQNNIKYSEKKALMEDFMQNSVIKKAIKNKFKLDWKRKIIISLINKRDYFMIKTLAKIRYLQKK